MTAEDFRQLALALPGAIEGAHMGHPDFRVNGRIFASLHAGDRTAMVKVTPDDQAGLVAARPKAFSLAAGAWGRQGCTIVELSAATARVVRPALLMAFELAASLPPPKRRTRVRR